MSAGEQKVPATGETQTTPSGAEQPVSILDAAIQHFQGSRRKVWIAEWGVYVWVRPLTLKERGVAFNPDLSRSETHAVIVQKGVTREDGTPAFKLGDRADLINRVDGGVLSRLSSACLGEGPLVEDAGPEGAEGN